MYLPENIEKALNEANDARNAFLASTVNFNVAIKNYKEKFDFAYALLRNFVKQE